MRLANVGIANLPHQRLMAAVVTALCAFSTAILTRSSLSHSIGFTTLMALLGGISGSAPRAYRSFVEGISVATAVVWIMWQSPINWRPSTRDVAIGVIVTAFLFALQHCNEISVASKTRISWVFAPLGIAAAQLLLHRLMPRNVIELILRFGEDNAIFLNNAALLHQGGVVDEQSGNHSAALSVVQSLRETLLRGGGPGPIGLLSFESLFAVYLLVISLLLYVASDFLIQERRNRPVGTSAFFIFFVHFPSTATRVSEIRAPQRSGCRALFVSHKLSCSLLGRQSVRTKSTVGSPSNFCVFCGLSRGSIKRVVSPSIRSSPCSLRD